MIRSVFFVIWLYGTMFVMGMLCLPSLLLPRKYTKICFDAYVRIARWGLKYVAGIETQIRGLENVTRDATLVAAKHQSMWETLCLHLVFADLRIIMKRELLFYPIFGWYALKIRQIPIDRGGTIKTLKKMTKIAKEETLGGASILIFPEGTRVTPGAPPAYHSAGLSSLYKSLELPITPVATNSGQCWPARGLRRHPGKIIYEILPQVEAGLPRKEMMARVETAIEVATNALLDLNAPEGTK